MPLLPLVANTDVPRSTNLVVILGMMQVSKKIPFEDPNWLNGIRGLYILSNLIILGLYVYCGMVIKKKNGLCSPFFVASAALFCLGLCFVC